MIHSIWAAGWLAMVLLWLADALGRGLPAGVDAGVAWLTLAATGVGLGTVFQRLWKSGAPGRTLLALLLLAGLTYFTGLAHELTERYFGDEGIYLSQARSINGEGRLLDPWFIYPHLLFYLDAFALWLASTLGPVVPFLARTVYGLEGPAGLDALITRVVTATMGAGTVVPVFVAARRVAGLVAAGLAGGLIAMCPLFIRVAHLNISDVAGGFFAALTFMACARLLDGESPRKYLVAGLFSGLAAGGKYPAGVVAVAVLGVWLGWRLRRWGLGRAVGPDAADEGRGTAWGLLWAGLVSIAAFVGTTPSFLAFPQEVLRGEGVDLLFGFRQYARGGWTGVVRASNAGYYLEQILRTFGLPAVLLGLTGVAGLEPRSRRRLLWLLPFPAAYLLLMVTMRIAVARNLLPLLPALAVLLGAGAAGWVGLAGRSERLRRLVPSRTATALVLVLCLTLPAWRATKWTIRFARPTTRDVASEWIEENLPPGSALVQEVYTPIIRPKYLYPSAHPRFVVRLTPEQIRDPKFDFIFLASGAYQRFFRTDDLDTPYGAAVAERYEEIFQTFELVAEWTPDPLQAGPVLRLYELDPQQPPWSTSVVRSGGELLSSFPAMRPGGAPGDEDARAGDGGKDGPLTFDAPGRWALAKGYLEPGRYRVTVDADLAGDGGGVQVLTRSGEEIDVDLFFGDETAHVTLPRRDKYFVYVRLPEGSVLRAVRLERTEPESSPPEGSEPPAPATSS